MFKEIEMTGIDSQPMAPVWPDEGAVKKIETVYLPELDDIDANDTLALQKLAIPIVKKKSLEESIELGKRIEAGRVSDGSLNEDAIAARDELIFSCAALNYHFAHKFAGRDVPVEDRFQEGFVGLQRAAEKYDWRLGYAFSTYAFWWLFQANQRSSVEGSGLPDHIFHKANKVLKFRELFLKSHGREPDSKELSVITDLTARDLQNVSLAAQMRSPDCFTDLKTGSEDENPNNALEDKIEDKEALSREDLEDEVDISLLQKILGQEISYLSGQERTVLALHYGNGLSLAEIGEGAYISNKKLSQTRIRQIELRALGKLKSPDVKKRLVIFR